MGPTQPRSPPVFLGAGLYGGAKNKALVKYRALRHYVHLLNIGHYATTPLRHYATTPLRHYATTPLRHYAATPLRRYAATPLRRYAATPLRRYAATR